MNSPRLDLDATSWQKLLQWGQSHHRDRTFSKDEAIPTRQGLLYFVHQGAVRLAGIAQSHSSRFSEEVFLGLIGRGQPFEIISQSPIELQAYAHVGSTSVIWLYWQELAEHGSDLQPSILQFFRYQNQRKLLWLSLLGQKRAVDRLLIFLTLLLEEVGHPTEAGCCLAYPLTHEQIGSAIGVNRVTVTRLIVRLREQGVISIQGENLICLSQVRQ